MVWVCLSTQFNMTCLTSYFITLSYSIIIFLKNKVLGSITTVMMNEQWFGSFWRVGYTSFKVVLSFLSWCNVHFIFLDVMFISETIISFIESSWKAFQLSLMWAHIAWGDRSCLIRNKNVGQVSLFAMVRLLFEHQKREKLPRYF